MNICVHIHSHLLGLLWMLFLKQIGFSIPYPAESLGNQCVSVCVCACVYLHVCVQITPTPFVQRVCPDKLVVVSLYFLFPSTFLTALLHLILNGSIPEMAQIAAEAKLPIIKHLQLQWTLQGGTAARGSEAVRSHYENRRSPF